MGLNADFEQGYRHSYLAVVDGGEVVYEAMSEDALHFATSIDGMAIAMSSKGYNVGNEAVVRLDSQDYSLNLRGFNIVVINRDTREVIDQVAFDTYGDGGGTRLSVEFPDFFGE